MRGAYINGKIYIEKNHFEEAMLVEEGIVKAVGPSRDILKYGEPEGHALMEDEIVDLQGKTVIPGLNDSHMHITHIAEYMAQPDINAATSIRDLIRICKDFAEKNPEACRYSIGATGWNQDLFTEGDKRPPTRKELDEISTEVPVILTRVCGHSVVCNTKALEMAGITKDTPANEGGTFEIGEDGIPTGFFTENAIPQVKYLLKRMDRDALKEYVVKATEYAASKGLTSIQSNDIGSCYIGPEETLKMLEEVYKEGRAKVRYRAQMTFETLKDLQWYFNSLADKAKQAEIPNLFAIGPLKLFKDGSIGSHTALMKDEYLDDPGNIGVDVTEMALTDALVNLASSKDMQVITHAIGDRAIEEMIDSYEKSLKNLDMPEAPEGTDPTDFHNPLRHGIVHFQCMDLELLRRAARLGVLALAQPVFLHADIGAVSTRFSKELNRYFLAFKTDLEEGIHLSFGSDSPVEDCNPFNSIYSAVNRKTLNGDPEKGFFPEECITVEDAIDCFTVGSAYAEFMEGKKGRLLPGQLADFLILDRDIFTCDPMEIKDIKPEMTIMGGEITYKSN